MKLKQCNIKGFFMYGFSEKAVLTVCTADFQSKSFWTETKIFADQKICAGDQI